MTDKIDIFRNLFSSGFKESPEWTDWFMTNVVNEDNILVACSSGQPVSCLLLDSYKLKLGEIVTDMGYISCATTIRAARHQGHMRRLLNDSLMEARSRGNCIVSLIPASERLYFYYDKFAFSTVFYADDERYTTLHQFNTDDNFIETTPDFESFHRLEMTRKSAVIHSRRDFENILTDIALDNGFAIAVADKTTSETKAMLFAVVRDETAFVKDIFSTSEQSRETLLAQLRNKIGERMIVVSAQPSESPVLLRSKGMARIVNVEMLLSCLAAINPAMEQTIRVTDPLLSENNATFVIHNGHVDRYSSTMRRLTLDVSVDTLARIIFNSARIGSIFNIPSFRPSMALMLD